MKKTLLIIAAALFTLTFAAPGDTSAQSSQGSANSLPNPYATQSNSQGGANSLSNPYATQSNSQGTANSLSNPYATQSNSQGGANSLSNPYATQSNSQASGNSLPNPYQNQSNANSPYAKTVVAFENNSNQTLTVYIQWNGGTMDPVQIRANDVYVDSKSGYHQTAELIFHEDLTGRVSQPKVVPLTGSNSTRRGSPVAADVRWVKQLFVASNWVSATD